jgi:hypothetical protein
MLWPSFIGGVIFVKCPHCGLTQAQPRGRDNLVCTEAACRKPFTRAEGEALLRRISGQSPRKR